jgi:putative hemolysin
MKVVIDAKDFEDLSSFFKGKMGQRFAEFIIHICAINKVNQVYDHSFNYTGAEFTSRLLNDLGVNYSIGNAERLKLLPKGAFITVSNHPYGGLDGIILVDLMAGIRADYKFMVNNMLSRIKTMKENFISVNPTGNKKNEVSRTNLNAIRETLAHIQSGHPMGFFPSGAVSDFSIKDLQIRDRKWQTSILHLIHRVKVPILPVRFFDNNSAFFYFLGLINWRLRSLRLPSEVFNKREHKTRLAIGNIISVQEQEQFTDSESLGTFLRKAVYEMPKPASFIPGTILQFPEKVD